MERELTRRCGRQVRVAEFVGGLLDAAPCNAEQRRQLFAGYVELRYGCHAWLGFRLDVWAERAKCVRKVQATSCYVRDGRDILEVTTADVMRTVLEAKQLLDIQVLVREHEAPALTGDELTQVIEEAVREFVDAFRRLQVQTLLDGTSKRARFEYEMLQHYTQLELLILRNQSADLYVLFTLPLLGEETSWDVKKIVDTKDPSDVFVPDGFNAPHFAVATDQLTISIGYPLDDDDNGSLWPLSVQWPSVMQLSRQVLQPPSSSKAQSSVELVASCKEMFLQQWGKRKDFIAQLRRNVIVLEYEAVDFSHVFFLLQEQLDEQSPLRIIVLRLQFTAAFSLTNCTSDLQLSMLDGEDGAAPVPVELPPASTVSDSEDNKCVAVFLEATRKALLRHFYGE